MGLLLIFTVVVAVVASVGAAEDRHGRSPSWLKMNDGREIPNFGFGTWLGLTKEGGLVAPTGDEVEKAVGWAIDAGYRHIDTAYIYGIEDQVGRAINKTIADGAVKREDLFVTTKLWNFFHAKDAVVPALKMSLERLNLDYVDLYLMHWPFGNFLNTSLDNTDYLDTWQGMIEARDQGLTKSIGVSNFNKEQLARLIASSPVKPANLQVEINLNLQQPDLLAYCREQGILVTGYSPFGALFPSKAGPDTPPPRVDDPTLTAIAGKYNKTVTQVVLRYLLELGVIPIPKSVTKSRIEENINIFDFQLTPDDKQLLKSFDRNYRTVTVKFWLHSPYYPFEKN